jgi:hypothetical protein
MQTTLYVPHFFFGKFWLCEVKCSASMFVVVVDCDFPSELQTEILSRHDASRVGVAFYTDRGGPLAVSNTYKEVTP